MAGVKRLLCTLTLHRRGSVVASSSGQRRLVRGRMRGRVETRYLFVCRCRRRVREAGQDVHTRYPLPR